MVNLFQTLFYKDFFNPIILPCLIISVCLLGIYIGSKYYYSDLQNKLNNLDKNTMDHISKFSRIHYIINIIFTMIHLVFVSILIITIIYYMVNGTELLPFSYYLQLQCVILLFSFTTFMSLAIPNIETSIVENIYINYLKHNITEFLFGRLTPLIILTSYSLIFIKYNMNGIKQLNSSLWHQIAILTITIFLFIRDIFFIVNGFKNINTLHL
jgi:hypothetical protein